MAIPSPPKLTLRQTVALLLLLAALCACSKYSPIFQKAARAVEQWYSPASDDPTTGTESGGKSADLPEA